MSEDLLDIDANNFNESDLDVESLSGGSFSDSDHDGEGPAAGVSLRGGAGDNEEEMMKMATELSDSLYKPKEENRPTVRFQEASAGDVSGQVEEYDEPTATSAKAKGKQPAGNNPASSHQFKKPGVPRSQTLTQQERQGDTREATYSKPPSVHTENRIPQTAPPLEKVLQFESDNIPSIALGVLTPTEQRKLQVAYYNMRNILLERSQKCPYRGCDRVFPMADEDRMQQHLEAKHMGDRCNFCDEVLYQHWTVNQRRAHFLSNHIDLFLNMGHVEDDNGFGAGPRPHGQVDYARESRYSWCPRCGRDHRTLDAKADREHHDSVCYPGAPAGEWIPCKQCGVIRSPMKRHKCRDVVNTMEWPYCHRCGLAMGEFSDLYRARHQLHCMGFYAEDARRCPWCHMDLEEGPMKFQKLSHIQHCDRKPDPAAQGPLDPETGKPWPYKPPLEEVEGEKGQDPPQVCTLCDKTIIQFDAHLLLKHIEDNHADFTALCIFCKLDYEKRGWGDDRQKILLHLDDHIHDRRAKMAADLAETFDLPDNHPYMRTVIRKEDLPYIRDIRDVQHTKELYDALWRVYRSQTEECEEDKKQIAALRAALLSKDMEVTALKAAKAKEGGKPKKPAINPFAPSPPAAPSASSATGQKENVKRSGKTKPKPHQKAVAR